MARGAESGYTAPAAPASGRALLVDADGGSVVGGMAPHERAVPVAQDFHQVISEVLS